MAAFGAGRDGHGEMRCIQPERSFGEVLEDPFARCFGRQRVKQFVFSMFFPVFALTLYKEMVKHEFMSRLLFLNTYYTYNHVH